MKNVGAHLLSKDAASRGWISRRELLRWLGLGSSALAATMSVAGYVGPVVHASTREDEKREDQGAWHFPWIGP